MEKYKKGTHARNVKRRGTNLVTSMTAQKENQLKVRKHNRKAAEESLATSTPSYRMY
ncbi:hypothetical protein [Pareuzebyella sediminis]|uniref:hypothetical protein n=1 Tax=Pareuzebyella sediminis TaxID=2607998 RepID=UPI0018E10839|nr:hypothetical protein [Pareuzebyella sediminis]